MTWDIIIDIQKEQTRMSLLRKDIQIAHKDILNTRTLSTALLPTLETLTSEHNISPIDIHSIDIQSSLSDTSLSVRIARVIAKSFLYINDTISQH